MQAIFKGSKIEGFILLEVLISSALIGIAFVAILGIAAQAINFSSSIKNTAQIDSLVKEEIEALRAYRDSTTWSSAGALGQVSTGASPYYMALDQSTNPAKWNLASGTETVNNFTRSIVFDKAYRDASGNLADSGTLDPDSIKVTVNIVAQGKTYQVVTYLTNWKK